MDDITDGVFRRFCRRTGAFVCVTEFVRAEQLVHRGARSTRRRARLAEDDHPTGIQVYGASADLLVQAARVAGAARPAFVDINCGCWVPRIAKGGAGAAWLRDPPALVAMVRHVVDSVAVPVTVKTRLGWGNEPQLPIVDLARRLEDVGIAGLTIHCRTAQMGHEGSADWSWAARAREAVSIPVVVNGDVRQAADAVRALRETGCAGVMIGRAVVQHPWILREARALLAGLTVVPPRLRERAEAYLWLAEANVAERGERFGIDVTRRHLGLLGPLLPDLRDRLKRAPTVAAVREALDGALADGCHSDALDLARRGGIRRR